MAPAAGPAPPGRSVPPFRALPPGPALAQSHAALHGITGRGRPEHPVPSRRDPVIPLPRLLSCNL